MKSIGVIEEAKTFGKISGYKLNQTKTQIILNSKIEMIDTRVTEKAIYLGVSITAKIEDLVNDNMAPLMQRTKKDMVRCNNLHLSIWGRCNLIKMLFLPRFLYFFQINLSGISFAIV